jgi:hypothetical protein
MMHQVELGQRRRLTFGVVRDDPWVGTDIDRYIHFLLNTGATLEEDDE